ncbi:MFS transporter [Streptococcus pacificus]|uniref:MFS transporter n=1 Tax=Streptococcus pacificus TaxID=2740577 RepID=A0ABS0ZHN0_9STRE|nr:MFS transporter [Streptococcus pacificus]MBJ8325499.1 MFS transporter [Streptococcus pacificus]
MLKKRRQQYFSYFLMYNFYFLAWSLFSTLISVYLLNSGFRPSQVSMVVSMSFLASMIGQPFIGYLNDRYNNKKVILTLFSLSIFGGVGMLLADNIWVITLCYSWVLLTLNGNSPALEHIAATGQFPYGRIRIWGTIGFATGAQLAGFLYDQIAPKSIFIAFLIGIGLSFIGVLGIPIANEHKNHDNSQKLRPTVLFYNKPFLRYLLVSALVSGVMMSGHTFVPALLQDSGLSVGHASTVVAIAVICEAPLIFFSYYFMDKYTSKTLLFLPILLFGLQYSVYALNIGIFSKIIVTLLAKHTGSMLFIMVNLKIISSLVDKKIVITALAVAQTVLSLSSIVFQNIIGFILDYSSYEVMAWFLVATLILAFILVKIIPLPDGKEQQLFS